jgi:hypothetical protein
MIPLLTVFHKTTFHVSIFFMRPTIFGFLILEGLGWDRVGKPYPLKTESSSADLFSDVTLVLSRYEIQLDCQYFLSSLSLAKFYVAYEELYLLVKKLQKTIQEVRDMKLMSLLLPLYYFRA